MTCLVMLVCAYMCLVTLVDRLYVLSNFSLGVPKSVVSSESGEREVPQHLSSIFPAYSFRICLEFGKIPEICPGGDCRKAKRACRIATRLATRLAAKATRTAVQGMWTVGSSVGSSVS